MPKRHERRKKKKFRRTPSGKSKQHYGKKKHSKHRCTICNRVLHGLPHGKRKHEVSRLSKSKRKPSVLLAGIVCGKCRQKIVEEAAKVKYGLKKINDVDLRMRKYVKRVEKKIE